MATSDKKNHLAADVLTEPSTGMFGHGRQPRRVPSPRRLGSAGTLRIVPNDAATYRCFLAAFGSKSLVSITTCELACLLPLDLLPATRPFGQPPPCSAGTARRAGSIARRPEIVRTGQSLAADVNLAAGQPQDRNQSQAEQTNSPAATTGIGGRHGPPPWVFSSGLSRFWRRNSLNHATVGRSRILCDRHFSYRAYNRHVRYNRHLGYRLAVRQTLASPRRANDSLPICRSVGSVPKACDRGFSIARYRGGDPGPCLVRSSPFVPGDA